jgi:hypothetical protein
MHGIADRRVVVTGAQLFDQWFTMRPGTTREAFCKAAGDLDPARPIILYMCSSSFICPDEVAIVRRWLAALRASKSRLLASANIIVRPHPSHAQPWRDVELPQDGGRCVVWPRDGASPIDAERQQDYFDNLHHAAAIVGVNTSGFLEAGILGRRSLVLSTPETAPSQEGTLHFRYLLLAGFLRYANDMDIHLDQLAATLDESTSADHTVAAFIADFLRPNGLEKPALPFLVEAVETLARQPYRSVEPQPWWSLPVRAFASPLGLVIRGGYKKRLASRSSPPAAAAAMREEREGAA